MIEARGLVKHYRSTLAIDNLSFDVRPGTMPEPLRSWSIQAERVVSRRWIRSQVSPGRSCGLGNLLGVRVRLVPGVRL